MTPQLDTAFETTCTPLKNFSLLILEGPDATKFLQGQVTCDVQKPREMLIHGAHCSAKGRMIANFDLYQASADTLLIRLPTSSVEALTASLSKYLVFSKANLANVTADIPCMGVISEDLETVKKTLDLPVGAKGSWQKDGVYYHQIDHRRLEIWGLTSEQLHQALPEMKELANEELWSFGDIEIGKGWVTQETVEAFIPQHLNLQTTAINGISFDKGCYTGQEIVARMHYKGNLKRHMRLFSCSENTPAPKPGTTLVDESGKECGDVVNSTCIAGSTRMLAVVTDAAITSKLRASDGEQMFQHVDLPYAITKE